MGTCSTCQNQNQECQLDNHCCAGLQCDKEGDLQFDGHCLPPRENGQQCWENSQCQSGNCDDNDFYPDSGECVPAEPWWRHDRKLLCILDISRYLFYKEPTKDAPWLSRKGEFMGCPLWGHSLKIFYHFSFRVHYRDVFDRAIYWESLARSISLALPTTQRLATCHLRSFKCICVFARRHKDMETLSISSNLCAGNPLVSGRFLSQNPVMRSFDDALTISLSRTWRRFWTKFQLLMILDALTLIWRHFSCNHENPGYVYFLE